MQPLKGKQAPLPANQCLPIVPTNSSLKRMTSSSWYQAGLALSAFKQKLRAILSKRRNGQSVCWLRYAGYYNTRQPLLILPNHMDSSCLVSVHPQDKNPSNTDTSGPCKQTGSRERKVLFKKLPPNPQLQLVAHSPTAASPRVQSLPFPTQIN